MSVDYLSALCNARHLNAAQIKQPIGTRQIPVLFSRGSDCLAVTFKPLHSSHNSFVTVDGESFSYTVSMAMNFLEFSLVWNLSYMLLPMSICVYTIIVLANVS